MRSALCAASLSAMGPGRGAGGLSSTDTRRTHHSERLFGDPGETRIGSLTEQPVTVAGGRSADRTGLNHVEAFSAGQGRGVEV